MKSTIEFRSIYLLLSLILIIFYQVGHGQTKTQLAPGNWHDPSLWFPFGVPTANDSVLTLFDIYIESDSTALALHVEIRSSSSLDIRRNLMTNKPGRLIIENAPGQALVNEGNLKQGGRVTIKHAQLQSFVNRGSCTILHSAKLIIDSTDFAQSLENYDSLTIAGLLEVKNVFNPDPFGFLNEDTIFLDSTGHLFIHHINGTGLQNRSNGTITSRGIIEIQNTGVAGLSNSNEVIIESGSVLIDSIEGNGITNTGIFMNEVQGTIDIGKITSASNDALFSNNSFHNYGHIRIRDIADRGINSSGVFNNYGRIEITEDVVNLDNSTAIYNRSEFNNMAGATILIDSVEGNGLYNDGEFINYDSIMLSGIGALGIENEDLFTNTSTGFIHLQDISSNGLDNTYDGIFQNLGLCILDGLDSMGINNNGRFINSGTIRIRKSIDDAVYNNSYILNQSGGTITIQNLSEVINGIVNVNPSDSFINQGMITMDRINGGGIVNSGVFVNEDSIITKNIQYFSIGNEHVFTNSASGYLSISDSSVNTQIIGILNASDFHNEGTCEVQECAIGIENLDALTNDQKITIRHSQYGLLHKLGTFENHGQLSVLDCTDGILLNDESTLNNHSTATLLTGGISGNPFETILGAVFMGEGIVDIQN